MNGLTCCPRCGRALTRAEIKKSGQCANFGGCDRRKLAHDRTRDRVEAETREARKEFNRMGPINDKYGENR